MVAVQDQQPTLREVAKHAGVSVGTASGVFSNKPSVSEHARAAVLAAASEIGYRPPRRRRPATSLAGSGVSTIGLVSRAFRYPGSSNPFYAPVLEGAEAACAERGISLVFEVQRGNDQRTTDLPLIAERQQAQGLLLVGAMESSYVEAILQTGIPCVMADHQVEGLPVDSVCDDDTRGGYLATKHLLDLGHVDPVPAIITGPPRLRSLRQRLDGYQQALRERGLQPPAPYVRETNALGGKGGHAEMGALLDLQTPPTAVFCANDLTALGALELLRQHGLSVPRDCSIVGYEDIDLAAHAVPPLTTVAVDKELLGMQAVWHLIERIQHPDIAIRESRLTVRLIERGSTGPKPSGDETPAGEDRDPGRSHRSGTA